LQPLRSSNRLAKKIWGYSNEEVGVFARVSIYEVPPDRVGAAAETFGQAIGQIREMTSGR